LPPLDERDADGVSRADFRFSEGAAGDRRPCSNLDALTPLFELMFRTTGIKIATTAVELMNAPSATAASGDPASRVTGW